MVRSTLSLMLVCFTFFANAQAEKKIKSNANTQLTVWKLMDGYPKEHTEYSGCKKEFSIDLNGGVVTLKGYSNNKKMDIAHKVKFSPFPKEMVYNGQHDFYIDANQNIHDVGQELELLVQFKKAETNKAETYFNWSDFLGMSVANSQFNESVNYRQQISLNMENTNECLLFTIKIGTANYVTGVQTYCNTYIYKYEKAIVTNTDVVDDCTKIGAKRLCSKTFKVEGKKPDGSNFSIPVLYRKKFYEFCPDGIAKQNISDSARYAGFDYVKIGEPSIRQNCAGRVSDQLWNIGLYTLSADDFFNTIIGNFGTKISGLTWGNVEEGDIVVYMNDKGDAKHVAIVKKVTKNSVGIIKEIQIDTKDCEQGVYLHTLPSGPSYYTRKDPLLEYGTAAIYRVNPKEVKLTPVGNDECD